MPRFDLTKVRHPSLALALSLVIALVVAACAGGEDGDAETRAATADAGSEAVGTEPPATRSAYDFPTGPAVLVPEGYEPPRDHVAATGGYLPVNGKPTLVFAESIT